MANRNAYHLLRSSVHLTERQRAILIGTLLGDGSLTETFSRKNLRLEVTHGNAQKSYAFWKYEALKPLVLTPPRYQTITNSWRFRTISHPELTELGRIFYRGRQKIVPKEIASLLEPIGLAVWFMDDGARLRSDGFILNTQCFTRGEVESLRRCLASFGIIRTSLHFDKSGWRLYIQKPSRDAFERIVRPFILPDLMYKLESPVETTRWLPASAAGMKI